MAALGKLRLLRQANSASKLGFSELFINDLRIKTALSMVVRVMVDGLVEHSCEGWMSQCLSDLVFSDLHGLVTDGEI